MYSKLLLKLTMHSVVYCSVAMQWCTVFSSTAAYSQQSL